MTSQTHANVSSLSELHEAWAAHPLGKNRAAGGRRALSGFGFQLALSVDAFVELAEQGRADDVSFEGLSDLARLENGISYAIQVKATLTKQTAIATIAEALAVDKFLEQEFPHVRDSVRFKTVVQRRAWESEPADLTAADLKLTGEEAARWDAVRERMLDAEVRASPRMSLAAKLFPRYENPWMLADALCGELLDALGKDESSVRIAERLFDTLTAGQVAAPKPPGRMLRLEDFAGRESGNEILLGRRPTIEQLSQGYFMKRDERAEAIAAEVVERLERDGGETLPVHWIAGASGAGKSVLMLQALQILAESDEVVVHSVSHVPGRLRDALGYWQATGEAPVVIAIDDLYAPAYRESPAWEEVVAMSIEMEIKTRIVVLTTGPDDYLEAFKKFAKREEAFDLTPVQIPDLSPDEKERFGAWFEARTGARVDPPREAVFVEAAFRAEIQRAGSADLGEFAQRFAERVAEAGAIEAVRSTLFLNSRGFGAPASLFEGHVAELDRLVREKIATRDAEDAGSIALFHPRLAAALYRSMVDPTATEDRAQDLLRGLEALLPTSESASALLKTLRSLGGATRRRFLELAWDRIWAAYPQGEHVGLIVPWMFAGISTGLVGPKSEYVPRLMEWGFADTTRSTGTEVICKILPRFSPAEVREAFPAAAHDWLERHQDDPLWGRVLIVAMSLGGEIEKLVRLAIEWLEGNPDHPEWGRVFAFVVEHDPGSRRLAVGALEDAPVSTADPVIWEVALAESGDHELILAKVTRRLCREATRRMLTKGVAFIADQAGSEDVAAVRVALAEEREQANWSALVLRLLDRVERDLPLAAAVREATADWLGDHPDASVWPVLWHALFLVRIPSGEQKERVLDLGSAWLDDHAFERDWLMLAERLLIERPPIGAEYVIRWLEAHPDRTRWPNLFQRVQVAAPDKARLRAVGLSWLAAEGPLTPGWTGVFVQLWRSGSEPDLVELGWQRLAAGPLPRWDPGWFEVFSTPPSDPVLCDQVEASLVENPEAQDWASIFRAIYPVRGEPLLEVGRTWLQVPRPRREWATVWLTVFKAGPDESLAEAARRWLEAFPDEARHNDVLAVLRKWQESERSPGSR